MAAATAATKKPRFIFPSLPTKECVVCGKEFQPLYTSSKCCSHKCSATNSARSKAAYNTYRKAIPTHSQTKSSRKRMSSISDDEQLALNRRIDSKLWPAPEPCKVYRAGDPEFDRICMELTSQRSG